MQSIPIKYRPRRCRLMGFYVVDVIAKAKEYLLAQAAAQAAEVARAAFPTCHADAAPAAMAPALTVEDEAAEALRAVVEEARKKEVHLRSERHEHCKAYFKGKVRLLARPTMKDDYETILKSSELVTNRHLLSPDARHAWIYDEALERNQDPPTLLAHRSQVDMDAPQPSTNVAKLFLDAIQAIPDRQSDVCVTPDDQLKSSAAFYAGHVKTYARSDKLSIIYKESNKQKAKNQRLQETFHMGFDKAPKVDNGPRLHYQLTSTSTDAILLVQKPEPETLLVSREVKEAVLGSTSLHAAEKKLQPDGLVLCFVHEKDTKLWEEVFFQLQVTSAASPTLGKGWIIVAALKRKMHFLGLYRNEAHRVLVETTCIQYLCQSSLEDTEAEYYLSRRALLVKLGYEPEDSPSIPTKLVGTVLGSLVQKGTKRNADAHEAVGDAEQKATKKKADAHEPVEVDFEKQTTGMHAEESSEEENEEGEEEEEIEPSEDEQFLTKMDNIYGPPQKKYKR